MINKTVEEAINQQINAELYSSYLYYAMAAHFESEGLPGFAHWMKAQAIEEMAHVTKFFEYLNDRGGRVTLFSIDAPPTQWDSPTDVFKQVYQHEVDVTQKVNALMDLAIKHSDHATSNFLQWFVAEQVEEEASVDDVLCKLKLVDKTEGGLFLLDQELQKRPIALPPELTQ